ncbi:heterokaryon incompatibility protein-domain-containing protein, partial [Pisolithus sp. B1]
MPTRLLHTHTSTLCDRDAQISHFVGSQQYNQLLSLVTVCDPDQRIEHIQNAVLKYFQYVMLSHRWGEGEPSLRDIKGRSVYLMSAEGGLRKLQAFCLVTCKQGYSWVWSDTCCIDKDSSAESQEAILSMFTWYRRSTLTIVHLSDVSDTGSLVGSEWLERGWTLQELLAPRAILFYTRDWSLYKNLTSSNHKADDAVIKELTSATGIEPQFLKGFRPGTDNARSRLQWASLRRTTRPEDIAYSLFGIFDLQLPVFYGESAEKALGRLLAEIISQSGDISVLDW